MTSFTSTLCLALVSTTALSQAAIELPSFFSDGMVLQQQGQAKIWGWLDGSGEVTVTFGGKSESAKTNSEGRWEVSFEGLTASAEGRELTISDGTDSKVIKDVLVGEVWIASGQSNMEWVISRTDNAEEVVAASEDPLLRIYLSGNVAKAEPQIDFAGTWTGASPESTGNMTAVGYYFAKNLRQELDVPVGIIECAWGGKPIESFISEEALKSLPEAKGVLKLKEQALANWDEEKARSQFEQKIAQWEEGGKKGRRPQIAVDPSVNPRLASNIYNGMIAPITGYGAKGAIWYQGESNANGGTASLYEEMLGCLVDDWRERWDSDLAFYYVQLANFREVTTEPGVESSWVVVQDEMRRALDSIKHSGMAVTNDIGAADDIHPTNKKDVGSRLARWALGQDYGMENVVMSGPLFRGADEKEGRMILSFEHNAGLKTRDGGPLKRFEIKAEDGTWIWADAQIEEGKVIVWSDKISDPAAVRYAWANNPEGANLVNSEGLPASCFTTEKP
ncbi:sialate O-acetylesterase [Roseibacillus persicicus]|uniref:sialate O-acetylesterase n=1 Tax=Roseibacillus persicicus TaxID=454148 RepID=UPI00280F0C19|nr:sialate O-acetylesterase [Roseibacillus persicicus]MDQ8190496.1 sialate O-acetylesterase [Roseibacillus persicicus]